MTDGTRTRTAGVRPAVRSFFERSEEGSSALSRGGVNTLHGKALLELRPGSPTAALTRWTGARESEPRFVVPPRALSEEEAEQEVREMDRRLALRLRLTTVAQPSTRPISATAR